MSSYDIIGATVRFEWEHLSPIEGVVIYTPSDTGDSWKLQPWWLPYAGPQLSDALYTTPVFIQTFARMSVVKEADSEVNF